MDIDTSIIPLIKQFTKSGQSRRERQNQNKWKWWNDGWRKKSLLPSIIEFFLYIIANMVWAHTHRVKQTHKTDVKVELEANDIQLILIAFVKEERHVPPSAKGNSRLYFNLFFLVIVIYFSFGSVCVLVIYLPLCWLYSILTFIKSHFCVCWLLVLAIVMFAQRITI